MMKTKCVLVSRRECQTAEETRQGSNILKIENKKRKNNIEYISDDVMERCNSFTITKRKRTIRLLTMSLRVPLRPLHEITAFEDFLAFLSKAIFAKRENIG